MQNIVILAGNIGQKPEARTTQGGTKITNFSLATSRPRLSEGRVLRDENGYRVMDTEWHRITCWGGLGKTVAEHCEKGMKVLVHGRIHYTKWTDAAGNDRYGCEIIAEKVDLPRAARNRPRVKTPNWSTATTRSRSEERGLPPQGRRGNPPGSRRRLNRLCNRRNHGSGWRETNTSPFRRSFRPGKDSKNESMASRA